MKADIRKTVGKPTEKTNEVSPKKDQVVIHVIKHMHDCYKKCKYLKHLAKDEVKKVVLKQ